MEMIATHQIVDEATALEDELEDDEIKDDEVVDDEIGDDEILVKKTKKVRVPKVKKAPRDAMAKTKIKKTRTVRRPYKSMLQSKLQDKQLNSSMRFEVLKKRLETLKTQLQRFNAELLVRATTPVHPIDADTAPGVADQPHTEANQGA
jgi:LPS O-antigen subunit length determinant protein (WzzB/FepE family)